MPKICIIADTHRKHRELTIPECDLLIHCGDICRFRQQDLETLEDIDEWFAGVPAKRVVCIGGNHDFPLERGEFRFAHADYLCDELIEIDGLRIYGAPWCPDLSNFAFYLPNEELARKWQRIPAGIDVLITHTPPHGILDVPTSGNPHLGCPHLRRELERIQPRLHAFGHVHASHGELSLNGTRFLNAAVVSGPALEVTREPFLIGV